MLVGQLRPGTLFKRLKAKGVELAVSKDELVDLVVGAGEEVPSAAYAQDGFWADHWTYDLDQLDSYLAIFPDKEEEFLWESAPVPFYQSPGASCRARRNTCSRTLRRESCASSARS